MHIPDFFLALIPGLLVHEAGHAVAALAFGFRVRRITMGSGPILLRVRLGAAWLVVRAVPFEGDVHVLARHGRHKLATAGMLLGGVLGNAALFVLAAILARTRPDLDATLSFVGLIQVGLIVLNLVPVRVGEYVSDGLALLQLLRQRDDGCAKAGEFWAKIVWPAGTAPLPPSPDLPELSFQCLQFLFDTEAWAQGDARAVLERLLSAGRLNPRERAVVLGVLATGGSAIAAQIGPARLDAWTEEGMALAPTPWMQVARARALAALGHLEHAMDLAAKASAEPLWQETAVRACLIVADSAARIGDAGGAEAWLAQAREMAAGCKPMLRAEVETTTASVIATNAVLAGYGTNHALLVQLAGPPDAAIEPPSPYFPEIARLWTLSNNPTDPDAKRQACVALRPMLDKALPTAERAFVFGMLAISGLTHETGAGDAELDHWSCAAMALAPTPTMQVVRAGVLVHLGQWTEGMRMAAGDMVLRPSERALAHLFVSQAATGLGEANTAATWLDLARAAAGGEAGLRTIGGRLADRLLSA